MTATTISRRSALTAGAAVVVGGVVGVVVARNSAAASQPRGNTQANAYGTTPTSSSKPLVAVAAVPANGGVIVASPAVVVTRTGNRVHAFSSICTHQGCFVNRVAGSRIYCPCHGSVFDATTGAVVAGPAPRPLPAVAVTVRNGEVYPR